MRNIPIVNKEFFLIINILVFIATYVLEDWILIWWYSWLTFLFSFWLPYLAVLHLYVHAWWVHTYPNEHVYACGCLVWLFENVWGPRKFLFYYIVCGVGAGLCQELAQYCTYLVYGLAHFDSLRIGTTVLPYECLSEYDEHCWCLWGNLWCATCFTECYSQKSVCSSFLSLFLLRLSGLLWVQSL